MEDEKKSFTVDEFYEYITKFMTPEQALKKLLQGSVMKYHYLKFKEGEELHPLMVMTFAAMDMGWAIMVKETQDPNEEVKGLVLGTREYMDQITFKKQDNS